MFVNGKWSEDACSDVSSALCGKLQFSKGISKVMEIYKRRKAFCYFLLV
jgi:hypothetical protein